MAITEIFYSTFWITAVSVIWFYTDWFVYYTQLLGIAESTRIKYSLFLKENPNKFFPDFLYNVSLHTSNRLWKFLLKKISCPFCLIAWLSLLSSVICCNLLIAGPVYVFSLFMLLQIRNYV